MVLEWKVGWNRKVKTITDRRVRKGKHCSVKR